MPKSEAQRRAQNKYDSVNYTMVGCKVRRDYAERVKVAAAAMHTTPGAIVRAALDRLLTEYESSSASSAGSSGDNSSGNDSSAPGDSGGSGGSSSPKSGDSNSLSITYCHG